MVDVLITSSMAQPRTSVREAGLQIRRPRAVCLAPRSATFHLRLAQGCNLCFQCCAKEGIVGRDGIGIGYVDAQGARRWRTALVYGQMFWPMTSRSTSASSRFGARAADMISAFQRGKARLFTHSLGFLLCASCGWCLVRAELQN